MKRTLAISVAVMLAAAIVLLNGIEYGISRHDAFPFRCATFTRYDLSRQEGAYLTFAVTQDLRFQDRKSGYLLLNGQVTRGDQTTILNRRIGLTQGAKIDSETYRYHIDNVITSTTDNTPDATFALLLAELTLDPSWLQLEINRLDSKTYLVGGPLSYLFTCQRY